jgi:hypothetical protein
MNPPIPNFIMVNMALMADKEANSFLSAQLSPVWRPMSSICIVDD